MHLNKYIYNYFLILFSIIPLTIIIGSAISVANILLIDLSFVIFLIYKKNLSFLKNKTIIYLFILYIYLIFNTFIAIDYSESILRNFGFIRIIILFIAFNYFLRQISFLDKMIKSWTIILSIIILDIFIEFIFGKNILGYGELYGNRIVSFFKDEPIVGGFVNSFFLIIVGFYLNQTKKNHNLIIIFSIVILISIFLTGERSNTIKALLALSTFLLFYKNISIKKKFLFFSMTFFIITLVLLNSSFLKLRYFKQIQSSLDVDSLYLKLYDSGFQVFNNHKIFGVGNKNYRVETCTEKSDISAEFRKKYYCTTHPHQIYFDFLSEHGLFGTIIILIIFYNLFFSKILETFQGKNYIKLGALLYLIFIFTPLIPSGAFFNNYMITLFAINLSIFYSSDKNLNIFKENF